MAESDAFLPETAPAPAKTKIQNKSAPLSVFSGSSLQDAPRGANHSSGPYSLKQIHGALGGPEQQLRSSLGPPIPALVWTPHATTSQLYQGGAAGQSHPPIVLRRLMTDGNASSELAISLALSQAVCYKHLLVWRCQ